MYNKQKQITIHIFIPSLDLKQICIHIYTYISICIKRIRKSNTQMFFVIDSFLNIYNYNIAKENYSAAG
jgi:hypothetical protein